MTNNADTYIKITMPTGSTNYKPAGSDTAPLLCYF